MTEKPAGISSDLQWMIESGQADQEMLAETLVNDHYLPIYRLALTMLGDSRGAHQAAMQTISGAMVDLPKQRRSVQVTTWLYDHAIKTISRLESSVSPDSPTKAYQTETEAERSSEIRIIFQSYGLKERYALALHYLLEWQVEDIASVLRVSGQAVEIQFDISRAQFRPLFSKSPDGAAPAPTGLSQAQIRTQQQEKLDEQISQSFKDIWPAPQLTQEDWDKILNQIKSHEAEKSARWRRLLGWRELSIVIGAILLIICLGVSASLLASDEPLSQLFNLSAEEPTPLPTPLPEFPAEGEGQAYVYVVQPGDRIENIAEDLGLPVERLLAWNDLTLDSTLVAGQRLEVLPYAAYFPAPTPIPQSPATKALKSNSDSAAIHQKIGASSTLWHTLWIDVQTVDYGPAGYIGSPRIYHSQAWIEQPAKSLELMGLLGEEPSSVSLVEEGRVYQLTPESEIPTLSTWNQESDPLLQNEVLREMVYPNTAPWGQQKGRFEAFGTEDIAMREALGVDWINESGNIQARLWLDKETGVLLRIQEFGGPDYGTLESDSMATALLFDLEIPGEALFDPHSLLTQDYATLSEESGADGQQDDPLGAISISVRPRLPDDPPPVDFNPASSQLHFQFPEGAEQTDSLGSTADEPATLFADGYTLGETMIYPPWGLQCERSPDGQHVVYNKRSDGVTPPDARLRWINVKSPQEVYEPLPGIAANSFAFAPDSRHLAVFGADPQMNTRSIYIVDLGTGESWPLVEVYQASSLVWSPDGSHLAFIGQKFDQRGTHIMIVHVRLEEIIFERPVQLSGSTQEFSWSSMAWGMEFPIPPGDMGTCATPPSP